MKILDLVDLKNGQRLKKMYEVLISHEAVKYYKRQDKTTKKRLNKCIENISKEPQSGSHIKRLHGELEGKYRYEMSGLRIIYEINIKDKIVKIKSIKGRGDIYK